MKINELPVGVPYVKYKSAELLSDESLEIDKWHTAEMARIDRVAALAKAIVTSDRDVLAKGSGPDIETAQAYVAALRKRHAAECAKYGDVFIKDLTTIHRFGVVMAEYVRRKNENNAEAARSRRFNQSIAAPLIGRVH
jgi:hypothetical protein